jgi:hypothetical protein
MFKRKKLLASRAATTEELALAIAVVNMPNPKKANAMFAPKNPIIRLKIL